MQILIATVKVLEQGDFRSLVFDMCVHVCLCVFFGVGTKNAGKGGFGGRT